MPPPSPNSGLSPGEFPETRWSVVLAAQGDGGANVERALGDLCGAYWYPIYTWLRRGGKTPEDAEDLTQGFFAAFLGRDSLRTVTPERGRLRSFLLTAVKNHLTSEWRRESAQKRGGGAALLSIDRMSAEERFASEAAHTDSPDALFDQSWAYSVLDATRQRLRDYYAGLGKAALLGEIEGYLSWSEGERPYREVSAKLGMNEAAVRFAVHRMRQRYQSLLRQQITDTVASREDAEEEMAHLCRVLAR